MNKKVDQGLQIKVLQDQMKALDAKQRELAKDGGSGDDGDMSDDWKTSVNTQLTDLKGNQRVMFGLLLTIVAMIVGLYVWNGSKFDALRDKFDPVNSNISSVSERVTAISVHSENIENSVNSMNSKIDNLLAAKAAPQPVTQP